MQKTFENWMRVSGSKLDVSTARLKKWPYKSFIKPRGLLKLNFSISYLVQVVSTILSVEAYINKTLFQNSFCKYTFDIKIVGAS